MNVLGLISQLIIIETLRLTGPILGHNTREFKVYGNRSNIPLLNQQIRDLIKTGNASPVYHDLWFYGCPFPIFRRRKEIKGLAGK